MLNSRTGLFPMEADDEKINVALLNIDGSEVELDVSNIDGTQKKRISSLIEEAKANNKTIIFTFTPGPFKDAQELPENWMNIPNAVGCTAQLTAFEKATKDLDAVIYAINKQSADYQAGPDGLLAKKNLSHLFMISDVNHALEKELNLPTLTIPDSRYKNDHYFKRFTFVFKPNGDAEIFQFNGSVNDVKAKEHIEAIKNFISPKLEEKVQASMGRKV